MVGLLVRIGTEKPNVLKTNELLKKRIGTKGGENRHRQKKFPFFREVGTMGLHPHPTNGGGQMRMILIRI